MTIPVIAALCMTCLAPGASAQDADWTFMVYLDGDNDLENAAINDFVEMAAIGSDDNVKILALFDRCPGYDGDCGDWEDTRRGIINRGDAPGDGTDGFMEWGVSIGEANMGDPQTLIDFVAWGMQEYPADHHAVILWNHGGGWRDDVEQHPPFKAVCGDETDNDILLMNEVRTALATIETNEQRIDLVGFDACLMGMVEVAYEIRGHADVMVGSEATEPNDGWPYNDILHALTIVPTMPPADLGTLIVSRYGDFYTSQTMAAIDLSHVDAVVEATDALAQALRNDWDTDGGVIATSAFRVLQAVNAAVIAEDHGNTGPGSHGLAIYFPEDEQDFNTQYNGTNILFAADTQWDELLGDFYSEMEGSWVADARDVSKEFDVSSAPGCQCHHIDLYDFCEKVLEHVPGVIFVDFTFDGTEDGSFHNPYDTLAGAVVAAVGGETILMYTGSSIEVMTITKNVTLRGCGGPVVIGGSL